VISFSTTDVLLILYVVAWPLVAGVLLLLLLAFWRLRRQRARLWAILAGVVVLSTLPAGFFWLSEWKKDADWSREQQYWQSVSDAAKAGDHTEALRLLATRENGLRTYVERSVGDEYATPDATLLRAAFAQCVDLLDDRTLSISTLLDEAVETGHPEVIAAWLDAPACASAAGMNREQGIGRMLSLLVPYTSDDDDSAKQQLRARQAEALRLLAGRYPALADLPLSDNCEGKEHAGSSCPTLLSALLDKWHLEGVAAILPLDAHASMHLPPVVLHVLRGEARQAAQAARADPAAFHKYLPSLLATAPLASLRAALRAAPPDEASLLTPTGGDTQYQHLSPLFDAAKRRDLDQPTWDFLWLLFDLFPMRLKEVDTDLYSRYVIGIKAGDARLDEMLTRLRAAGTDCEAFGHLVGWGDDSEGGRQWIAGKTGCPRPSS
jgi:hypothetical protein